MSAAAVVQVGVVGLGYWGPNLARNFGRLPGARLTWLCDEDDDARARVGEAFPEARTCASLEEMLADPELDAVAVATPVPTHAAIAERVLATGKHCFVEKPLALSVLEAERVVAAAHEADRVLMVGHLLEYHPGLEKLKEYASSGQLGDIHYIYGNRLNLGKLRAEENALWSLGAHDVAVLLRLAGEEPYHCQAVGESYMRPGVEDVVFCYLRFPSGLAAHLHLSWLDPHKERRFTVVGSKKMATFDDMEARAKAHDLRQGLRRGLLLLRRVHRALGGHAQPARAQPRAAADRVRPLRGLHRRGPHAALGRGERPEGRAGARAAAGVAR